MAKHTTHTYTCDRCGADIPDAWIERPEGVTVKTVFFTLTGGRRGHDWEHVCEPCTAAIKAFFDPDPLFMKVTAEDRRMIGDWTP